MKRIALIILFVTLCTTPLLHAQNPGDVPAPLNEHEWLYQFVGEWESVLKTSTGPGQPEFECLGKMTSRKIGGLWVVSELQTDMMGSPMTAIQTLGYDPKTKKYIGTWIDSMYAHMWKYTGTVDESTKSLTLEADGPSFTDPEKSAKYRDIYQFKSADLIVMTSKVQGDDGKWTTFMSGQIKRKQK